MFNDDGKGERERVDDARDRSVAKRGEEEKQEVHEKRDEKRKITLFVPDRMRVAFTFTHAFALKMRIIDVFMLYGCTGRVESDIKMCCFSTLSSHRKNTAHQQRHRGNEQKKRHQNDYGPLGPLLNETRCILPKTKKINKRHSRYPYSPI